MASSHATPRARKIKRDAPQLVATAVAFVVILGGGIYFGQMAINRSSAPKVQASAASSADLYSGSIVVTTAHGNECRERTFDNVSGRVVDRGPVSCDEVSGRASGSQGTIPRIEAISKSFRSK